MFTKSTREYSYMILFLAMFASAIPASAADEEAYVAFVINNSRDALNNSGIVRIAVERWTTDEERNALIDALASGGHDGFVKALHSQDETGFVRSQAAANTVGGLPRIVTRFARKTIDNGKTIITLVTDRPMRAKEDPEYKRFSVSALRLELPADAKGTGVVYVALKVSFDPEAQRLLLQSATREPIQLTNVSLKK